MIRCHLSRLMGEKKVKIIEVARETGISRNMISALYYENAKRIDLDTLDALCVYFDCQPSALLEYTTEKSAPEQK
ncbi:MAG: helix-turn-helix transcriptional regulator [Zetaproteobacteria bacterium]|nr:helix-turn-helix transcriptional regulator [Zetaproteobacteria bacterium]